MAAYGGHVWPFSISEVAVWFSRHTRPLNTRTCWRTCQILFFLEAYTLVCMCMHYCISICKHFQKNRNRNWLRVLMRQQHYCEIQGVLDVQFCWLPLFSFLSSFDAALVRHRAPTHDLLWFYWCLSMCMYVSLYVKLIICILYFSILLYIALYCFWIIDCYIMLYYVTLYLYSVICNLSLSCMFRHSQLSTMCTP